MDTYNTKHFVNTHIHTPEAVDFGDFRDHRGHSHGKADEATEDTAGLLIIS